MIAVETRLALTLCLLHVQDRSNLACCSVPQIWLSYSSGLCQVKVLSEGLFGCKSRHGAERINSLFSEWAEMALFPTASRHHLFHLPVQSSTTTPAAKLFWSSKILNSKNIVFHVTCSTSFGATSSEANTQILKDF